MATLKTRTAYKSPTSTKSEEDAAKLTRRSSIPIKRQCLLLLADAGEQGMTDDELSVALDERFPRADGFMHNPSKIASRRKELQENRNKDGEQGKPLVVEVRGQKRVTRRGVQAQVFRASALGKRQAKALQRT